VPLGHVLSADRRRAALAWSAGTGGALIEIACDGALRADAARLPRLLGRSGTSVAVVGGFGDLLTPSLGLGYAVVPAAIAASVAERMADHAEQPSGQAQLALAHMLADGTILRRLRQVGVAYERQRRLVELRLAGLAPRISLYGRSAVNTVAIGLPAGLTADAAVADLRGRGVEARSIAGYYHAGRVPRPALLLGFGHLPDAALVRGLGRVARYLASERSALGAGPLSSRGDGE
jgi:GntR family transcriptional regulator/MocR family aminotransferase